MLNSIVDTNNLIVRGIVKPEKTVYVPNGTNSDVDIIAIAKNEAGNALLLANEYTRTYSESVLEEARAYTRTYSESVIDYANTYTNMQFTKLGVNLRTEISTAEARAKSYAEEILSRYSLYEVVSELPEVGTANKLYLVAKSNAETNNIFDEYLWVNDAWEYQGTKTFDIDLTQYQTKEEAAAHKEYVDELIGTKLDKFPSGGASRAYAVDRSGNQKMFQIYDTTDLGNATQMIPLYYNKASTVNYGSAMSDQNAVLITAEPNQPYQAANKKYVDENFVHNAPAMADPSGRKVAYGADKDGNILYFPVGSGAGCIPQTNAYGLLVGSWEVFESSGSDNTYTPKKAVENMLANATVLHQITLTMYAEYGGDEIQVKFNIYSTNPNDLTEGYEEDPYGFVEQYLRPATPVLISNPLEPTGTYLADMVATISDDGRGIVKFATLNNTFDRPTDITDEIW